VFRDGQGGSWSGAGYAEVYDFNIVELAGPWALPGYTFTRTGEQGAVDSTGAVQWFPANVPAINDRGYHAYGALTNENTHSHQFDNAAWTKDEAPVTANAVVAPDGTMTADTLAPVAGGAVQHRVYNTHTGIGANSTKSVFAKRGTINFIALSSGNTANPYAIFNLLTGAVATSGGGGTAYIVDCGDGWYRCVLVGTSPNAFNVINFGPTQAGATPANTWAAAGTETVHLWQAQTLSGNFPDGGPLIRTAGSTANIGASSLFETVSNAADFFAWGVATLAPSATESNVLFTLNTGNGPMYIYRGAGNSSVLGPSGGLGPAVNIAAGGRVVMGLRRVAGKYTGIVRYGGTTTIGAESGVEASWTLNGVYHGVDNASGSLANGQIEGTFVRHATLSNAEIQAIVEAA
jgi:hypothetical protein